MCTAAAGAASHLRFAVASCSSLYSGWFNAYRRIAERRDRDAMIQLGDYIYDFVDEQERVRVPPSGTVEGLSDVASHRRRHAQYLSDPDLRLARQAHPWIMLWDNHDLSRTPPEYGGGVQAYREWNALPALDAGSPAATSTSSSGAPQLLRSRAFARPSSGATRIRSTWSSRAMDTASST
jgi:hypothetical protein